MHHAAHNLYQDTLMTDEENFIKTDIWVSKCHQMNSPEISLSKHSARLTRKLEEM